jgi:type 1 glutamine amidotransferase
MHPFSKTALHLFFSLLIFLPAALQAQEPSARVDTLYFNAQHKSTIAVITITAGFYHEEAIPAGKILLTNLGKEQGVNVVHANSLEGVQKMNFKDFKAVVFLCTTLDIFDLETQSRFESFIREGGGYLGIHAAADTEYKWDWYGQLVGGYFVSHPPGAPKATITTLLTDNYFTNHLPTQWSISDEWYNYDFKNPKIIPLLNLEESTYSGGTNGGQHPIAWYHYFDGGRSFYTGLGHLAATYEDPRFIPLLRKGLRFAMGLNTP